MKNHTSTTKRMLLLVAAVMTLAASCTSGGSDSNAEVRTGDADEPVDRIAEWIGTDVPTQATNVQYEEITGGIDDSALVRFTIPADELDALVADLGIGELQNGRQGFFYTSGPDWFQTSELENFAGRSETVDGRSIQITADLSNGETTDVYILAADI